MFNIHRRLQLDGPMLAATIVFLRGNAIAVLGK